jgi:hypothetical protein
MLRSRTTKTRIFILPLLAMATLAALPLGAQILAPTNSTKTISDTAGSTLLGPYFEVDLSNPTGMNTIFTVNNMGAREVIATTPPSVLTNSETAMLAHVTIWSDLGVPVFNFNIYLTGWDVDRIDMRKVLNGQLPRTASAGQDPTDTISPKGNFSQDINFASCNGGGGPSGNISSYPLLPPAALAADQINNLQTSLTGQASAGKAGKCAGANHSDNIARGYITIDTVNNCTSRFPGDSGYFGNGGTGDATKQLQLTGEVTYVDQLHGVARGDNMVIIHADSTSPDTTTPGTYTFYGRYDSTPFNAEDNRQPLPAVFGARYVNGNFTGDPVPTSGSPAWGVPPATPPAGSTSLVVWRDSKVKQQYFTCGANPSPYPLSQEDLIAFDEQEHAQSVGAVNSLPLVNFGAPFPIATQVVKIGSATLPVSFTAGWMYLALDHAAAPGPSSDPAQGQAWVQVIEQNGTKFFNIMHRAQALDSGTLPSHVIFH